LTHPLVTIRGLRVDLGGGAYILKGLDADIMQGQITALIGLNGSGKTTLLRAILREVPFSGTIRFHCGHDHSHPTPQHVGYVPQKLRIDANFPLTVRDLLAMALQRRPLFLGISRHVQTMMADMLAQVDASPSLLDRPVGSVSGGELQRVLLALALRPSPELLLLDEPAQGIDFKDQEKFYDLIARISRETGVSVLLVSHELSVVTQYAHHVLCLKDGQIDCQGTPQEIINNEVLTRTFGSHRGVYAHSHDGAE
jgi:zinc transport system ATP-binding protein